MSMLDVIEARTHPGLLRRCDRQRNVAIVLALLQSLPAILDASIHCHVHEIDTLDLGRNDPSETEVR